jgi:hypothetical protein
MKLRTLTSVAASIWIAITDSLDPEQRANAYRVLAETVDDTLDPVARCVVEAILEDARPSAPVMSPEWHASLVHLNA